MDINSMFPDQEDLTQAFNREFATLRESMSNIEELFKRTLQSKMFIDEDELAQILHCPKNSIPAVIPKYRGCKVGGYLYRLDEVYEYLEGKRIPKRQ